MSEAKQQWKPKPGERVLVEAIVQMNATEYDGMYDDTNCDLWLVKPIHEYDGSIAIVPLLSLRPLPVTKGEAT